LPKWKVKGSSLGRKSMKKPKKEKNLVNIVYKRLLYTQKL
jgi:hypothetical protein